MSKQVIIKALNETAGAVRGVKKDSKGQITKTSSFDYVSGDKVYAALAPIWVEKGLDLGKGLVPNTLSITKIEYERTVAGYNGASATVKQVIEYQVQFIMEYTWRHIESDEEIKEQFPFVGLMDDPSKALGTAMTYSDRYYLLKRFNIQTDKDDADAKPAKEGEITKQSRETAAKPKTVLSTLDTPATKEHINDLYVRFCKARGLNTNHEASGPDFISFVNVEFMTTVNKKPSELILTVADYERVLEAI